jgi:hypothetical protein
MYSYSRNSIIKNLINGIKKSPETMGFLKEQAEIVLESEKNIWQMDQSEIDLINPELFCEYENKAQVKLTKYLKSWLEDIFFNIHIDNSKIPPSIGSSIEFMIFQTADSIGEEVCSDLSDHIMYEITKGE